MEKDKDLESIKNGNGLKKTSTTTSVQTSGLKTDQRNQTSGVKIDRFTYQGENSKSKP